MALSRQAFLRGLISGGEAEIAALSISERCLARQGTVCRICEEFCDVDAIRFQLLGRGRSEPSVDLERCTLCRACADACPVSAITIAEAADLAEVAP